MAWKIVLMVLGIIYTWIAIDFFLFGLANDFFNDPKTNEESLWRKIRGFFASFLWLPVMIIIFTKKYPESAD